LLVFESKGVIAEGFVEVSVVAVAAEVFRIVVGN
jgi:hypothetical protein